MKFIENVEKKGTNKDVKNLCKIFLSKRMNNNNKLNGMKST